MAQSSLKIQCPAKINRTLKVIEKRSDGFHNIESIMQTINLYDYLTLTVEPAKMFKIKLSGTSSEIPYDEKNLAYKACLAFIERINMYPCNITIFIEKNIPVSAGLAGGSSNAAGVIFGMNEIFRHPLSRNELHELCAKLGSDLNFCLEGGRQKATGRGEILKKLPFEQFTLSLIKPIGLGISAKEAYAKFSTKDKNAADRANFVNDLEWAVIDDYEELREIKQKYPSSVMSGSGPAYYDINTKFEPCDNFLVINNLNSINSGVKLV